MPKKRKHCASFGKRNQLLGGNEAGEQINKQSLCPLKNASKSHNLVGVETFASQLWLYLGKSSNYDQINMVWLLCGSKFHREDVFWNLTALAISDAGIFKRSCRMFKQREPGSQSISSAPWEYRVENGLAPGIDHVRSKRYRRV